MAAHAAPASKKVQDSPPSSRRRRSIPWWALSAAGLIAAAFFGLSVEHLRFGPPFVMLCLGGGALGWATSALWRGIAPLLDELPDDERVTAEAPHHRRELEREKQLVLKAIKEVELDFQMRKVAPEDYKDMSERYRARAMRLLAELDAGDDYRALIERELKLRLAAVRAAEAAAGSPKARPARLEGSAAADAPAPAPAGSSGRREPSAEPAEQLPSPLAPPSPPAPSSRICAACATVNDDDAVFCKKCGKRCGEP